MTETDRVKTVRHSVNVSANINGTAHNMDYNYLDGEIPDSVHVTGVGNGVDVTVYKDPNRGPGMNSQQFPAGMTNTDIINAIQAALEWGQAEIANLTPPAV